MTAPLILQPMKRSHTRIAALNVVLGAAALTAGLAGCATSTTANGAQAPASAPAAAATSSPTVESVTTDQDSCAALGDVLTIVQNAGMGLKSGRMDQDEYDGWLRLATRVLDRVPVRGDGQVSTDIDALKTIAPAVSISSNAATGIATRKWDVAPVDAACQEAGAPLQVQSFTGG